MKDFRLETDVALVALNAGAVVGLAALAIGMLRSGSLGRLSLPKPLASVLHDFGAGIKTLNRQSVLLALLLTAAVWFFEVAGEPCREIALARS